MIFLIDMTAMMKEKQQQTERLNYDFYVHDGYVERLNYDFFDVHDGYVERLNYDFFD